MLPLQVLIEQLGAGEHKEVIRQKEAQSGVAVLELSQHEEASFSIEGA